MNREDVLDGVLVFSSLCLTLLSFATAFVAHTPAF